MWIKEIHIEGFGIFNDLKIPDLSEGLNIFSGMNESGKSTLLEFICRILFGFPDRRTKRNPYPALNGGRHGGRLILQSNSGKSYTIERFSEGPEKEAVVDSQGTRMETHELFRLLGHANERIYTNVYAFGLSELQDFKTLNSDEVKDRLYSAGTGTGGRAISELIRNLEKERGDLYLPQGSKPEINLLFKKVKDKDQDLKKIRGNVEQFDHFHDELKKINEKISEIEINRSKLNRSLKHTENLLSCWEDWRRLRDAQERLSQIPEINNFPEKGKELLGMNISFIQDIDNERAKRSEELEKNSILLSKLHVNDKVISVKDEIFALQKGQEKYAEDLKELPGLVEKQRNLQSALKESLKEIGPEWSTEKVLEFDTSIPAKEKVREKRQAMQDLHDQIRDLDRDKKSQEKKIEKIRQDQAEKEEKIKRSKPLETEAANILIQKNSIKNIRIKFPQLMRLEASLQSFNRIGVLQNLGFPKPLIYAFYILVLSIIGYFLLAAFQRGLKAGIGILSGLFIFSVVYYVIQQRRKQDIFKDKNEKDEETEVDPYTFSGQLQDIDQLRAKIKNLREDILKDAQKCGFDRIPSPEMIEETDKGLQDKLGAVHYFNEEQKKIQHLENELSLLRSDYDKIEYALKKTRQDLMEMQIDWETWLADSGLNKDLSPEGVLEIFNLIKTVREQIKTAESLKENINKTEYSIKKYEKESGDLLKAAGITPIPEENNALVTIEKISSELEQALKIKSKIEQLELDRKNLMIELKNLEKKKAEKQKAVDILFKQAGVDSEPAFRERAEQWDERTRLLQLIQRSQENIKKFSGEGEAYSQFLQELTEASPEVLEAEKAELEAALNDINDEWDALKENRGSLKNQIEQIKQEEESSRLRMDYEAALEELRNKSDSWAVLTLARAVLKKAVENYERERQPEVVQEAQRFFSLMTTGSYSRIYAPLDETPIFVETKKDNVRKETQELSRGTAEQLYLSLRFGFIREFSQHSESLPVIFDDILVNFDPGRSKAACQAIKKLAQNHQVIFFTCHPETVKMFEEFKPGVKFLSIGG